MNPLLTCLAPVADESSALLVLGSMPGRISLERGQYYAHPRNRFWRLASDFFNVDPDGTYSERIRSLTGAGVALWDVLQHCERDGSLDAAISPKTEIPNDLGSLLRRHSGIRAVAFNGRKSAAVFNSHILPSLSPGLLDRVSLLELPSTSPANTTFSYAQLLASWSATRSFVRV